MAWDETMSILYIGGSFHAVDNITISSGLAMWSRRTGLISFPGGGVSNGDGGVGNTQVKSIAYEPKSEVNVHSCLDFSSVFFAYVCMIRVYILNISTNLAHNIYIPSLSYHYSLLSIK